MARVEALGHLVVPSDYSRYFSKDQLDDTKC